MKLIEKKCPNCGSNLKFKHGDKDVTCDYCNCSYVIDNDEPATLIDPETAENVKKAAGAFIGGTFIIQFIIIVITSIIFLVVFIFMFYEFVNFKKNRFDNFYQNNSVVEKIEANLKD